MKLQVSGLNVTVRL